MTIAGLQRGNIFYPFLPLWLQFSQSQHSQHNGAGFPSSNHSHISCAIQLLRKFYKLLGRFSFHSEQSYTVQLPVRNLPTDCLGALSLVPGSWHQNVKRNLVSSNNLPSGSSHRQVAERQF
ncbi:Ribosomal RNA large subunit methyltransferase [Trichinella pseudospiralis]